MIINYKDKDIDKFICYGYGLYGLHIPDEIMDHVHYLYEHKVNERVYCPYITKKETIEEPESVEYRTGFLGLKKVTVQEMRKRTTSVTEREGIHFMIPAQATRLDGELLMPKIINNPVNINEILKLVKADPRFLYQINPSLVKKEDIKSICEAASEGLQSILDEQSELDVTYNDDEHQQRIEYMKVCADALQKFQARWLEMEGLKNLSDQKA